MIIQFHTRVGCTTTYVYRKKRANSKTRERLCILEFKTIIMAATSDRVETCEVCAAHKAKYTCPKCEVRTCGLACVNIHKKELECDGKRDKTKFIPLNSFTDLDLLNDYRLLEEIGRSVEQLQTDVSKKCTRQTHLPVFLQRLKNAATSREINLQFMPQNFSRHKENTTYLNWKTNEFFWKVEFIFPQAENTKWVIDRVIDTKRLSVVLEEILYSDNPSDPKDEEYLQRLSILQNKLKFYQASGLTGLRALLKAEKIKKSNSRFYELDLTLSIQENLKNKSIIENPIIYVALKDHSDMFEIIDSDDEEFKVNVSKPFKRKRGDFHNKKMSMKKEDSEGKETPVNYFFSKEDSDSDNEIHEKTDHFRNKNNQELFIPDYNELVKMDFL